MELKQRNVSLTEEQRRELIKWLKLYMDEGYRKWRNRQARYRRWWPDMLQAYKENCIRSGVQPEWLHAKENFLQKMAEWNQPYLTEEQYKIAVEELRAAIEAYCRDVEKRFALYQSWWPDMLREYKERCEISGNGDIWPFSPAHIEYKNQERKNYSKGTFGKKRKRG